MEFEKTATMVELEFWASEAYGHWLAYRAFVKEIENRIEQEES